MDDEVYYLIDESTIRAIKSKIVILNRAVQLMYDTGFESMSQTLIAYGTEITTLINSASKCEVVPRNKTGDANEQR